MIKRRETISIKIGNEFIGSNHPILVQSMCKTSPNNIKGIIKEIKELEKIGCKIIRIAVPNMEFASKINLIKKQIKIPLVADIHFDYKLALEAISQGVDKIRINPGNIKEKRKIKAIIDAAKEKNIPIRIGINTGSIFGTKTKNIKPEILVEKTLEYVQLFEDMDFKNLVISVKSFDIPLLIESHYLLSSKIKYPFHIGVTESGPLIDGNIRSSIGIGVLLAQGIGDTIRVSLTDKSINEVKTGYEILKVLNLEKYGPTIISCPTCGRCNIDIFQITKKVQNGLKNFHKPIKIAIMGCVVNGPGESSYADIGIAGGKGYGMLFKKGEIIKKIKENEMVKVLLEEVKKEE